MGSRIYVTSAGQRILVVDDEWLIRWSLGERLRQEGFDAAEAESGEDALSQLRGDPGKVALVVLDLKLPGIDGLAVVREIRKLKPDCPVIMMTAFGSPEAQAEAQRLNVLDMVGKPFDIDEMIVRVRRALAA